MRHGMPRWIEGMALLVILVLMSGGCMTQREVVGGQCSVFQIT